MGNWDTLRSRALSHRIPPARSTEWGPVGPLATERPTMARSAHTSPFTTPAEAKGNSGSRDTDCLASQSTPCYTQFRGILFRSPLQSNLYQKTLRVLSLQSRLLFKLVEASLELLWLVLQRLFLSIQCLELVLLGQRCQPRYWPRPWNTSWIPQPVEKLPRLPSGLHILCCRWKPSPSRRVPEPHPARKPSCVVHVSVSVSTHGRHLLSHDVDRHYYNHMHINIKADFLNYR